MSGTGVLPDVIDRPLCERLDEDDPLAPFRERFDVDDDRI
jgi:hypothetical protein